MPSDLFIEAIEGKNPELVKMLDSAMLLMRVSSRPDGDSAGNHLVSWNGMSGGPILALQDHGSGCEISLLAVQVEFGNGIATGCYVYPYLTARERELESPASQSQ